MFKTESRYSYPDCLDELRRRLDEPPPTRIQLLAGPRQVGKTTLLLELAAQLGPTARYHPADGPAAALPGFWERIWSQLQELAMQHGRAVLLLDEAHLLPGWAARLKGEWDRILRLRLPIHVIATGSSALRLTTGSHESLAGRFERLVLAHWSAAALVEQFGLPPDTAATQVVLQGSYPGAVRLLDDPPRWAAYLRDAIVEPAIGRDLLALAPIRKPALLRQLFGVCVSAPAQIVALQKIQGQLQDGGALETLASYLTLLEEAYLVAGLTKFTPRLLRQRAAPPKLLVLNNALLAATATAGPPHPRQEPARFGTWVENACLAHAWNRRQQVRYWRQEPHEVDAVLDGSWGRWAVEVKTGRFAASDLRGLFEFTRCHPEYRPLVLCDADQLEAAARLGAEALSWTRFLLADGPARGLAA